MRLTGLNNAPVVFLEEFLFEIRKAITLRQGRDVALIATGSMVPLALEAATELEAQGFSVRVIDMHTVKPLDVDVVNRAAQECDLVVSIEEHSIGGGLGSALAEVIAELLGASALLRLGFPDEYLHFASYESYLARAGLTAQLIADKVGSHLRDWRA